MPFLFSWRIVSPFIPRKKAVISKEMEYGNTLVINFTIKWTFVVHAIIQFLVKSHFHKFSLSYKNVLRWKYLFSPFLNQLTWDKWLIFIFSKEQTAISQMPTKPTGVHQYMGFAPSLSAIEILFLLGINLEVW